MRKVVVGAGIAVAAAFVFALFSDTHEQASNPSDDVTTDSSVSATAPGAPAARTEPSSDAPPDDSSPATTLCAQFKLDESHPWVVDEFSRLEPFLSAGPGFSVYRGLSEKDLLSLAAQNDSGAMMVLGRRAEMRARGLSEEGAVDDLDGLLNSGSLRSPRKRPSVEVRNAALADAEHWYYEAALNGRVIALFNVGMIRGRLSGGAAGLGWMGEEELRALDADQRTAFMPAIVYGHAAFLLAPEVTESPMMIVAMEDLDFLNGNEAIVDGVVNEFQRDMADRGLTLPAIAPYSGPGIDAWRAELCGGQ